MIMNPGEGSGADDRPEGTEEKGEDGAELKTRQKHRYMAVFLFYFGTLGQIFLFFLFSLILFSLLFFS